MLQSIRDRAQGWIAWFIVALISVPFALWGIQEYIGGGTEPLVATVNVQKITEREFERRYRDYRQSLRQRLGDAYRADLFDEAMLRKESLESMIRSELIIQQADTLGMKAGADMIRSAISEIPAASAPALAAEKIHLKTRAEKSPAPPVSPVRSTAPGAIIPGPCCPVSKKRPSVL